MRGSSPVIIRTLMCAAAISWKVGGEEEDKYTSCSSNQKLGIAPGENHMVEASNS